MLFGYCRDAADALRALLILSPSDATRSRRDLRTYLRGPRLRPYKTRFGFLEQLAELTGGHTRN